MLPYKHWPSQTNVVSLLGEKDFLLNVFKNLTILEWIIPISGSLSSSKTPPSVGSFVSQCYTASISIIPGSSAWFCAKANRVGEDYVWMRRQLFFELRDSLRASIRWREHLLLNPIGSMYGIFTYMYHKNQPNVGKYTSPMDPMGMNLLSHPTSGDLHVCWDPETWTCTLPKTNIAPENGWLEY